MLKIHLVHLMLLSSQTKLTLLPPSTLNNLSKLLSQLMLPQEMMLTPMPLTILKLMLETPEMSKLSVKFHTTHTQLENNGPDNQPTDSFNILMDPTQSIFTNPTVLILTEITRLLKLKDQSFQKNKMDGNQRETPTTGLPKLWLANKDGQMK
jgi:hypothetical protein